jgi:serine protease AprX
VAAFVVPMASASDGGNSSNSGQSAIVPPNLLSQAQANPDQNFDVIVQSVRGKSSDAAADELKSENGNVKRKFASISGVSASISGKDLLKLARHPGVMAITPDVKVKASAYENAEMWRDTADTTPLVGSALSPAPKAPAIALVDSGIDKSKLADFGTRVVADVNLSSLSPGASGDAEGHGTMVAGVAAGGSLLHQGASPTSPIVSLRTSDANGQSLTSDVIAACDWILKNKAQYGIRVANFSMSGASATSFRDDPLDHAVESLWFNGIVVVAAAGNHGTGSAVPIYAPGNDPFVITVGATDQHGTSDPLDDTVAPWSAFGHTLDGFGKPDVSAPGRYMIMPVPAGSTIPATVPDRVVAPGYMWMSGTSFSAPVVAGAAAQILARNPGLTPGQVKGALMVTANYLPSADFAAGVGEIDAAVAASISNPPNANENLDKFVGPDPATGAPVFNSASWANAVAADASWTSASWNTASWSRASWSTASWSGASWSGASWSGSTYSTAFFSEATSSATALLP